ncbi:MAG TPA: hypothetical protein VNM22_09310 [Candidatus Limnocylindrales bacterium]|nr:hypothetical protein [Candidatus Limnocylindrales bacterium]
MNSQALQSAKTGHLFLLVGGNPLPNAVAGKLLTAPGGTITLIHSGGAAGTAKVAQRLCKWLKEQGVTQSVELKEVGESDPTSIVAGAQERLKAIKAQRVGLNYTGGTKAIAVHAYRAVEQWTKEKGITPVFSYLDARTLQMVFDPAAGGNEQRKRIYIGRALELKLTDLLALHGWTLKHEPTEIPLFPATAHALARVCANDGGFKDWKQWIEEEFRPKCRRPDKEDWKNKTQLQAVSLILPTSSSLSEVVQSLRAELKVPQGDLGLAHGAFGNEPKRFCEWLYGKWLEHYVLDILNQLATQLCLHECAQNIVPNEVEFDVDVMALRGYQLFAFSCSTESKKNSLKLKLFEAYIRARQLGGDEARVALVCCSDDPDGLEHEMRRDVDPEGRIRVFGRKHLRDLTEHIKTWIQSQSGEEG